MKNTLVLQRLLLSALLLLSFSAYTQTGVPDVSVVTDAAPGMAARHGLAKLLEALKARHLRTDQVTSLGDAKGKTVVIAGLSSGDGEAAHFAQATKIRMEAVPEALSVSRSGIVKEDVEITETVSVSGGGKKSSTKTKKHEQSILVINGFDDRGLMYALLDAADRIGWNSTGNPFQSIKEGAEKPDTRIRAVSIYTMNRTYWESRLYDENYWTHYLDMLALDRFNTLVIIFGYENGGFLAPCYPYFFNTEGYPDVRMVGITAQQQQKNLEAFNRLIKMCHDRAIDITVGIWDHIYRGGVQGGGIPGTKDAPDQPQPGLVWGLNGDNLTDYTKASLRKFVQVFPGLDAIQFRMHDESGLKNGEQEAFWADVFRMMKATAPNLSLDLRAKELKESIIQSAINTGIKFRISTKYWMEQMGMPYHPTQINPEKSARRHSYSDMLRYPKKYDMHWCLWNGGTSRVLLWGDPDYVRRFTGTTHLYDGDGLEVNEPLATKMEAQPHDMPPFELLNEPYRYYTWEFERYWHFFQLFGRIGYNPAASPDIWQHEFKKRFGAAGPLLEQALHEASWVLPRIVASDYPYSLFPTTRGWAEKQRLGNLPQYAKLEGSDMRQFANFDEEAQSMLVGTETPKVLPSANSRWFEQRSAEINRLIAAATKAAGGKKSKEFVSTVTDLSILSNLALYHARRIPAGISYRLFSWSHDPAALDEAIRYEKSATQAWAQLVKAAGDVYTKDLMMGVRVADLCGHWKDELDSLNQGIVQLEAQRKNFRPVDSMKVAPRFKTNATDYNKLFTVSHTAPAPPRAGQPVTVKIRVTAPAGVKWVRLRFRNVVQEQEYQTLVMQPGKEKGLYEATIPAADIDPQWDLMYFIEMMDRNGHGRIFPDLNKETPYRFISLARQ